ncbi:uncharacterized protein LOC129806696 [Phlebotomus papatasi]|uniref:uncharacterized protein LOC129806696 n=1 Tax=Phlebotomus papatasi TaxID=29031 RepID=UPI002483FA38|nr:uncharacterized protein LOC129806696 [Phlebotomus papatasi]
MNCGVCKKKVSRDEPLKIKCNACSANFHGICVKVGEQDIVTLQEEKLLWNCSGCKSRRLSFMRDGGTPPSPSLASLTEGMNDLRLMCEPFADLGRDVKDLRSLCEEKFGRLDNFFGAFENLVRENKALKITVEQLQNENVHLKEITAKSDCAIMKLDEQVEKLQQQANLSSIEIHGLPDEYKRGTNNTTVAVEILRESLGIDVNEEDILSSNKFPMRTKDQGIRKSVTVVRFVSQSMRSRIMLRKRDRLRRDGGLFVHDGNERFGIYVSERLTSARAQLLRRTREAAKEKGYKYVWVVNGVIKARRSDREKIFYINSEKDLLKLT